MAYRDDNEALQAKVEGLEEELAAANATLDELQGVADLARPELLPKRSHGFKPRARMLKGPVDPEVYDRIAQVLQRAYPAMHTSLDGRTLSAKSGGLEVTLLPVDDDDLLMVFDERSPTNYTPSIGLFVFSALAALGAVDDRGGVFGLLVLLTGMLIAGGALYFARRSGKSEQALRDDLFASVGGLVQRSAAKVRVADEDGAPVEVVVDMDVSAKRELPE